MVRVAVLGLAVLLTLGGCAPRSSPEQGDADRAPSAATEANETERANGTASTTPAPIAASAVEGPSAEEFPDLHNLLRLSKRVYSGGQPEGEPAFAQLAQLGVKVVVSVDGAAPDLETAKKHGLRYVHIPIGYDGIPEKAGDSLARLVRDLEGPFYVHCHHGKHRGPAAAAVACLAEGTADAKSALAVLERAGTSKRYAGLWRDVENYSPPAPDAPLPELTEVAEVSSLVAAMTGLDRNYDLLTESREAEWSIPPDHPDVVPAHEALLVREGLHEIGRQQLGDPDDEFRQLLADAERAAADLEAALQAEDRDAATESFERLSASCTACHAVYRDLAPQ